ncbi:MAG: hypothetical protein ACE5GW_00295 [Planctomycetota bacterium]
MPERAAYPTLPVIVLGGSDRRPVHLPDSGAGQHPLCGYKGADVRLGGRTLISVLLERLLASGAFNPVLLAGPAEVYRKAGTRVPVIDTDGSFGRNVQVALETVRDQHPGEPVAITTCDILPDPAELEVALADYHRAPRPVLWYPLIRIPEDRESLGVFGWKPAYQVVPEAGEEAVRVLPGHMVVVEPGALRRRFLYRLLEVAYRTRNRPIAYRRPRMVGRLATGLILQDLLNLVWLRPPSLTWTVLRWGLDAARKLKGGCLTRSELEEALARIFVRRSHRRKNPDCTVRVALLDGLSLAEDIDTLEEAKAVGGGPSGGGEGEP